MLLMVLWLWVSKPTSSTMPNFIVNLIGSFVCKIAIFVEIDFVRNVVIVIEENLKGLDF